MFLYSPILSVFTGALVARLFSFYISSDFLKKKFFSTALKESPSAYGFSFVIILIVKIMDPRHADSKPALDIFATANVRQSSANLRILD